MDFTQSTAVIDGVVIQRLEGALDVESARPFRSTLVGLLEDPARSAVVVDLTDVTFFDSSGLKVLDDAQRIAVANGIGVAIVCPNPQILRLFDITGLTEQFTIHSTADQAIADNT